MVKPINDVYSFSSRGNTYSIEFSKDEMIIPAALLTAESKITVTVTDNGTSQVFDDCVVTKVERKGSTIDTFNAYVSSKTLKKYSWTTSSKITIVITYGDAYDRTCTFNYVVSSIDKKLLGEKVEFKAQ